MKTGWSNRGVLAVRAWLTATMLVFIQISSCSTVDRAGLTGGWGNSGGEGGTEDGGSTIGGRGAGAGVGAGGSGGNGAVAGSGASGGVATGGTGAGGADAGGSAGAGASGAVDSGSAGSTPEGGRACATDADCAGSATGAACDAITGLCVTCVPGGNHCAAGLYCTSAMECEVGCAVDADCPAASAASVDGGAPGGDAGPDAGPDAGNVRCDTAAHVCVGCRTDAQCGLGTLCDVSTAACVPGCTSTSGCPTGLDCCSGQCADIVTSEAHCGACDIACAPAQGAGECVGGNCNLVSCSPDFEDCNGIASDGCEADLRTDPLHCADCATACPALPNGAPACVNSQCALGTCAPGFADCEGDPTNGCETNTRVNINHCGTCYFVCDLLNASEACTNGSCVVASCAAGYGNCDNVSANGCEVNVTSNALHCGGCGTVCNLTGATAACVSSACTLQSCNPLRANCNGDPFDGCEVATNTDPEHCGGCFQDCTVPNATAGCDRGACVVATCNPGFQDCDGDPTNGCEANLDTNILNCGQCGSSCSSNHATASCSLGSCSVQCDTGFTDCDGNPANGCEVNTAANVDHCGNCGNVCQATGGTPVCNSGVCGVSSCVPPLGDCDADSSNGCESNLSTTLNHCGGCGKECFVANGTPGCTAGTCYVEACNSGYADCNGLYQDGCEALLNTSVNCGQCGQTCQLPNANASCATGNCQVSSCNTPYDNCDGNSANGCEVNTDTNAGNCGSCGAACDSTNGAAYCVGGLCQITCGSGFGNCNAVTSDGCETSLLNNPQACGACGNVCSTPNGTPSCLGTTCVTGSCSPGFADCDLQVANGCETNTAASILNCGQCGRACSSTNGSSTCTGGTCEITCNPGWANCDNNALNGCEVSTNTVADCGGCGLVCTVPNAAASCSTGACVMTGCNAGFGNCDGLSGNGCEASLSSTSSCGSCGNLCTNPNGSTTCVASECMPSCAAGFADCNGNPNDGCETSLRTVTDCGGCGAACALANAAATCDTGVCELGACDADHGNCDGDAQNGCETDTSSSASHCGACGQVCSSTNGTPTCNGGTCGVACSAGFANCDGSVANGCETNTTNNPSACGGCGVACTFPNAAATCLASACQMGACLPGYADCDGLPGNGCETDLSTLTNCGGCGNACDLANASESCVGGQCVLDVCAGSFADCDVDSTSGCEVDTLTDAAHCGGCGAACDATSGTPACNAGSCEITCDTGFGDCDLDPATGCEAPLNTVAACGGCATVCSNANGTTACTGGVCAPACVAGFGDCDGDAPGGCETDLGTAMLDCGTCGNACTNAHGTTSCASASCVPVCAADWGDCDGNPANGCETDLTTTSNCGQCDTVCANPNGTTACTAGNCAPTCTTGFSSCDGNSRNGCETNTNTNVNHCSTCGFVCNPGGGTPYCINGVCGASNCGAGLGDCDGDGTVCETDLLSTVTDCGGCGNACVLDNATPSCTSGTCSILSCDAGFESCDGLSSTGCETRTDTSVQNCGGCGNACSTVNGTASCTLGACAIACASGFDDCDGDVATGCEENTKTSALHCGGCNSPCQNPNGTTACSNGACVPACAAGYADCDGDPRNGCETDLNDSIAHCGACGSACTNPNGTTSCSAGVCVPVCNSEYESCDGNARNGCETSTATSGAHCGACGTVCSNPQGSTSCVAGACTPVCSGTYADCDGNPANGCESNTNTNVSHCGACDQACSASETTASCIGGACTYTCNAGFANCDGQAGNGCEADLNTVGDCGGCGNVCSNPNGTTSCPIGTCLPVCGPGFGDCNGNPADGCERNVNTITDCGACGAICDLANATESCEGGVCTLGACAAGSANCDGISTNGCETSTLTSSNHCGACGQACTNAHGSTQCTGGACVPICAAPWADCDGNPNNGCNTNTSTTPTACGACGNVCSFPNASATCSNSVCAMGTCNAGYGNCSGGSADGCETDLAMSPAHCGACGSACTNAHGATACSGGVCVPTCAPDYGDCDGDPQNGCETSLRTPSDCGGCGVTCSRANAAESCATGTCQTGTCDPSYGDCDGVDANGCETNTSTDPAHCSACGQACSTVNGTPSCGGGTCGIACATGFGNCDGDAQNGCEVNLNSDALNCTACGASCSFANASATCFAGACQLDACNVGFANCDSVNGNGCEASLSTLGNCGGCGVICNVPGASESCSTGTCTMGTCNAGRANCDGDASNGCEVNTTNTTAHCGACNAACSTTNGTAACVASACTITCTTGHANCDNSAANGCEASLSSTTDCGTCGNACTNPNGATACIGGACSPSCSSGFGDCNGNLTDGCETSVLTTAAHCGACGQSCTNANGTTSCSGGACQPVCAAGFADCDGDPRNGCERPTTTTTDCGGCGIACANTNGTTACDSGVCAPTCANGYGSCDGNPNDGCETSTNTDINNCGTCDFVCPSAGGTPNCVLGVCGVSNCQPGLGDCDGSGGNGCETDLSTSMGNCGACGSNCNLTNATEQCTGGSCNVVSCSPGFGNCDTQMPNGCEIQTDTNLSHCGACGTVCSSTNGTASCALGACSITCAAPYGNCDGDVTDGCETNTTNTTAHCGGCGIPCTNPNGTTSCSSGTCQPVCSTNYASCNGDPKDGCETNTQTSASHCGACGQACSNAHGGTACVSGACQPTCSPGYADCDGNPSNGCETSTASDAANCGACGVTCGNDNGTTSCIAGACMPVCSPGFASCNGNPNDGCEVSTQISLSHCGGCGQTCGGANATGNCSLGACQITCSGGFANCNSQNNDGCEVDLNTTSNCGTCGNACTNANGATSCSSGVCQPTCSSGFKDCNGDPDDGCERSTTTLTDCGNCNAPCALDNALESCSTGTCTLGACTSGFGDCDSNSANGCEAPTTTLTDCGTCGNACTNDNGSTSCSGTACLPVCTSGFGNCDSNPSNGCETNTTNSTSNCGACGTVCGNQNGFPSCSTSACSINCNANYGNCDGDFTNGCEASLLGTTAHCSACNSACTNANGTTSCSGGACQPVCAAGYASCDGDAQDGCETSTATDVNNCGGCGTICTTTNASSTSCSGGGCQPVCSPGWGDCDGNAANGCEANTDTSTSHCGACGNACVVGACSLGACDYAFPYIPSNFDPASSSLNPGATNAQTNFNCGTTTFNSTTGVFSGTCPGFVAPAPVVVAQSGGSNAVVLAFQDIAIASGSTFKVVGNRPVIVAAYGDATIAGTLTASSTLATTAGAGANQLCSTSTGTGGTGQNGICVFFCLGAGGGGGGGGGFGTAGGAGGIADGTAGSAGVSGGNATLVPLRGGCPGGPGGRGDDGSAGGAAGYGGGAVQLSVAGTLTISGSVNAAGGGGVKGGGQEDGGGGGGSGGGILIEGKVVTVTSTGWVSANGGGGASGNHESNNTGNSGTDGTNTGGGGPGGASPGGNAGGGGTGDGESDITNTGSNGATGGGGGGGGGRGRIHFNVATSCQMSGGTSGTVSGNLPCPTCFDGVQNGAETDVDCGGNCAGCAAGDLCTVNADCSSDRCESSICRTCSDGVKTGAESDIDCGGPCSACADGLTCNSNPDCQSNLCVGGACDGCSDGVLSGDETGIDCGGGTCPNCPWARWAFNETSGIFAADWSGNNRTGILSNFPSNPWVAGQLGNALTFDGSDDYVSITSGAPPTGPITITAWINTDTIGTAGRIVISKRNNTLSNRAEFQFGKNASGVGPTDEMAFSFNISGTWYLWYTTNLNLVTNTWTHVAVSYAQTVGPTFYKNGVAVARQQASGSGAPARPTNTAETRIGGAVSAAESPWDGKLDDVRIYGSVLSLAEVQSVMSGN